MRTWAKTGRLCLWLARKWRGQSIGCTPNTLLVAVWQDALLRALQLLLQAVGQVRLVGQQALQITDLGLEVAHLKNKQVMRVSEWVGE